MPHFEVFEGEAFNIPFELQYDRFWSEVSKRGQPVKQSEVTTTFFFVKEKDSDANAFMTLTDATTAEIEWTTPNEGKLTVKLDTSTEGKVGKKRPYELRIKLVDGTFTTVDSGTLDILESTVDTP